MSTKRPYAPPAVTTREPETFHCFGRRTTMIHEFGATISLCGEEYPDLEADIFGLGKRPRADLREFAPDAEATCPKCLRLREKRRPSWLRRWWRRIRGTEEPTTITVGM